MPIKHLLGFLFDVLSERLSGAFTGKIVITLNCKKGGIGNVSVSTEKTYGKDEIERGQG